MPSIVPLMSKSWSCGTLLDGLHGVQEHYEGLRDTEMTEQEMRDELQAH